MDKNFTATEYLSKVKGEIYNICEDFYNRFLYNNENTDNYSENLKLLLNWDFISDETYTANCETDVNEYQKKLKTIEPIVEKVIDNLIAENLTENDFYSKLAQFIKEETLLRLKIEKICALVCLMQSLKIPYYKIDNGLTMSNDEFVEISKKIFTQIRKSIFILAVGSTQKTEISSRLLHLLEEIHDHKEKVVFLANVIGIFEKKMLLLVEKLETNTDDNMFDNI